MKNQILTDIRQTLRDNIDEKTLSSGDRYFKEEVKLYGVSVALVNQIGKLGFEKIKELSKIEIFELCEELWTTIIHFFRNQPSDVLSGDIKLTRAGSLGSCPNSTSPMSLEKSFWKKLMLSHSSSELLGRIQY